MNIKHIILTLLLASSKLPAYEISFYDIIQIFSEEEKIKFNQLNQYKRIQQVLVSNCGSIFNKELHRISRMLYIDNEANRMLTEKETTSLENGDRETSYLSAMLRIAIGVLLNNKDLTIESNKTNQSFRELVKNDYFLNTNFPNTQENQEFFINTIVNQNISYIENTECRIFSNKFMFNETLEKSCDYKDSLNDALTKQKNRESREQLRIITLCLFNANINYDLVNIILTDYKDLSNP